MSKMLESSENNDGVTGVQRSWTSKYSSTLDLSLYDNQILLQFVEAANRRAEACGVNDVNWRLQLIASEANIELSTMSRNLYLALWIEFLCIMKEKLSPDYLKYQSLSSFLNAYSEHSFDIYPEREKINLMNTANWMNILFRMEKAKKNKGLAMDVVPRVVEGPNARYITGSGQTHATADRVHIYEVEGNIEPMFRGRRRKNKKVGIDEPSEPRPVKRTPKAYKKRIVRTDNAEDDENALGLRSGNRSSQSMLHTPGSDLQGVTQMDGGFPVDSSVIATGKGDSGSVTWTVSLGQFGNLSPTSAGPNGSSQIPGSQEMSGMAVDLTDGTDDSFSDHDGDTASVCTIPGTDMDLFRDEMMLEENLHDYWEDLERDTQNGSPRKHPRIEETPTLLRQLTDRPALLELLDEVGGPSNPAAIDEELNPAIFSTDSIELEKGKQSQLRRSVNTAAGTGTGTGTGTARPVVPSFLRQVSWGGKGFGQTQQMNSMSAFPAPHISYQDVWQPLEDQVNESNNFNN